MTGPLQTLRVLELGGGVSAPYCGKLLADLGADVLKVEPPGGDPSRHRGPFKTGIPDADRAEASAPFLYLNSNKRSTVLSFEKAADVEVLRTLIRESDVLVDNHAPGLLEGYGLDADTLAKLNPELVVVSITPYGTNGPNAQRPGDELTLTHAGGLGFLLPTRSRDVTRAPVKLGGYQVGYHGGLAAALAVLSMLYGPSRFQQIDISLQEVILALVAPTVAGTRYLDLSYHRVPDRPPAMGRVQTSDGYVVLNAFDDHHFAILRELMGDPEWCAGEEWLSMAYRVHHLMDIAHHIDAWALTQTKHELHKRAGESGIPIGPILNAAEVLEHEQYRARSYFQPLKHPVAGEALYAGWPYDLPACPPQLQSPAPRLGEHQTEPWRAQRNTEGDIEERRARRTAQPQTSASTRPPPLEGVRILEFCWVWAGPYAGSLLGALGADVIKVEGHRRSDLTRRSLAWPRQDHAPRVVLPNQGMAFNQVNMNKRSLTLDLRQPEGLEIAKQLAARADVVVDNMRPGALEKLGLGYRDLQELKPDLIAASSSGRGNSGKEREYLGYAMVHQAIGGGAYISGYPDDHPTHSGGDVDLMNAMALAFSIVAALHHRRESGEGQFIDYSQCEGVSSLLGDVFLGYQLTGELPERNGNRDPSYAPHSVYRCWGVDRWLAIEVHDDATFSRLMRCIGKEELIEDPRFATAAARKKNEAALDEIIERYTRERDRDYLAERFAAEGIPAAPSRDALDLYADRHLHARGAFVRVDHPELGPLDLIGPPWRLGSETVAENRGCSSAPQLGQHNFEILAELGLSTEEIEELVSQDVILG